MPMYVVRIFSNAQSNLIYSKLIFSVPSSCISLFIGNVTFVMFLQYTKFRTNSKSLLCIWGQLYSFRRKALMITIIRNFIC